LHFATAHLVEDVEGYFNTNFTDVIRIGRRPILQCMLGMQRYALGILQQLQLLSKFGYYFKI
jgi:hypothetical protein